MSIAIGGGLGVRISGGIVVGPSVGVQLAGRLPYADRAASVIGNALIARWPLNEASGTQLFSENTYSGNIAENGTLEEYTLTTFADYWGGTEGDGSVDREESIVHAGSYAVKLTAGPTRNSRTWINCPVVPGESLTLTFWTRGDGTNALRSYVANNTLGGTMVALQSSGVTGTTWTQVTREFTVPADTYNISVGFYCPNVDAAVAYLDDVVLTSDYALKLSLVGGTLNQAGFSSGEKSIYLSGATGQGINMYSPALRQILTNLTSGTMLIWATCDAEAWADAETRYLYRFKSYTDAASSPSGTISAATYGKVGDSFNWQYIDSTVSDAFTLDTGQPTGWIAYAMTWQAGGDAVRYENGVEVDRVATGAWVDIFDNLRMVIGNSSGVCTEVSWQGYVSSAILCDGALTGEQIAALSRA